MAQHYTDPDAVGARTPGLLEALDEEKIPYVCIIPNDLDLPTPYVAIDEVAAA